MIHKVSVKPPSAPSPSVCFSFAAYCKIIIQHLKSQNVDVSFGLTNQEISAVESSLGFSFPLDLRSILQSGLPLGIHFPNWRTGSTRNLRVLFNLPLLHLSKFVARNGFWVDSWGIRPRNDADALNLVKKLFEFAPILVPVYGNCYVPLTIPNLAGNPVFQIDGDGIRVLNCDVAGFLLGLKLNRFSDDSIEEGFNRFSVDQINVRGFNQSISLIYDRWSSPNSPWGKSEGQEVEFWTEVAAAATERGKSVVERGPTRGWWGQLRGEERLRACLDEAFWKLRGGGWSEEEVCEMLMDRSAFSAVETQSRDDVVYELGINGCDGGGRLNSGDGDTCREDRLNRGAVTTLGHLFFTLEA